MKKKPLQYALGILVTALALWLSFRNLDWGTLTESFSRVNLFWVFVSALTILLSVLIVSWRWQILLKSKARIPLADMFRYNIIAQYVNIIIPARFGELLRAWLAARKYALSGSYVLGTILIEKMIESYIVVIMAVLAPLIFTFQAKLKGHNAAVVVFLILIPLLVLVIWKRHRIMAWLTRLAAIFPAKVRDRILIFLEKGMEAFTLLKNIKMTLQVVFITFVVILSQVLTNLILFKAFGFKLSLFEAIILQVVLLIGMSLPSIPGRIGVFEYTVYLALSMFDIEKSVALGYGLMLHVIAYIPKIILGMIFAAGLNISLKNAGTELDLDHLKKEAATITDPGPEDIDTPGTSDNPGTSAKESNP